MLCIAGGIGNPFQQTPIEPSGRMKQAASGGFLLDTFLWQKNAPAFFCQRKVSRSSVQEPTLKNCRISGTSTKKSPQQQPKPANIDIYKYLY
jgi:hypothetical protein